MKKVLLLASFLLLGGLLTGCTLGVESEGEVVTVYSERHYDTDQALYDLFEEETGITVEVIKASADELMNRLELEGEDTQADVLMIADAGRLHQAKTKDLLQTVDSDVLESNIPANYQDADNFWFGLTKRARILVYHPDRVDASELSTYEDLADPKWQGRIVVRSSTNIYNQSLVASLLDINGETDTRTWIEGLVANFARNPEGNDRDQAKAVMAGIADVAIMNTYYMGKMANSSDPLEVEVANTLEVFFPNQDTTGAHVNISAAGVTKYAPNYDNAVKLIEFLSSETAQNQFSSANYEYPVNPNVEPADLLKSWGDFVAQDINLTVLGENNAQAAIVMDEEDWK
jgi:iron(III) transport system substrate-binding protein